MIKSYTMIITEIDEAEDAVAEAKNQLNSIHFLKNTIGIVAVHPEYLINDIYVQVVNILPFKVVGATTISQASNGFVDTFIFSILILTSDDCKFTSGLSDILPKECDAKKLTQKCYTNLCAELNDENKAELDNNLYNIFTKMPMASDISEEICTTNYQTIPKLTLIYVPSLENYYPSQYIDAISEIDPKIPIFGMVANDEQNVSLPENSSRTLLDGQGYYNRIVMVLISGDISPEFYISSLPEDVVAMPRVGEVTAADKNKILEINNINAVDFFEKVGFIMGDARNKGLLSTTFIMDIKEKADDSGVVISRTPYLIQDKAVYCGGHINTGAILSIAFSTTASIVKTAEEVTRKIKNSNKKTALLYSCVGRRFSLLSEPKKEMETIADTIPEDINYIAAYANGEICPVLKTDEKTYNRDHNQTLIACVF